MAYFLIEVKLSLEFKFCDDSDIYYIPGKYAMRDLVQKLPSVSPQHDHGTSDDTIAAVLATLNEVIKKHPEFSR